MISRLSGMELSPSSYETLEKDMASTLSFNSHKNEAAPCFSLQLQTPPLITKIFGNIPVSQEFSNKVTQKAAAWLLTVAWSKDYCPQTSWTALMLFYGYKLNRVVPKTQLESLLLVCLQLATKIHESFPLKTSQLFLSSTQPISRDVLASIEQDLLELFDYNLYTSHTLELVASHPNLDEDTILKALFLGQLYLAKDPNIFFEGEKMSKLVEFVTNSQIEAKEQQLQQIKEMVAHPSNKIIVNKYSSKFDMDLFLVKFQ